MAIKIWNEWVSVFFTGCKANSLSANVQEKPAVVEHSSCIGIQMRLPWANVGTCYERDPRLNKFSNELGRMYKNDVGLAGVRTQTGGVSNIFKLIKTNDLTDARLVPCISGRYKACRIQV